MTNQSAIPKLEKSTWLSIKRGLRHRCASCGEGKLFRAYLKQVDSCSACGQDWKSIRADDGPAWATMLIVGHLVGPILVATVLNPNIPQWVNIALIPLLAFFMCIAMLPSIKGAFMGIIWATGAPTS